MNEFDSHYHGAYTPALAYESIPDELRFGGDVEYDILEKFARTVAYKVFHNIKLGYKMSKEHDPITVGDKPAPVMWPDHYKE